MLQGALWGAMHGQLQGGHMKNRRVTVFRMDKENEKCIIQKKTI